MPDISAMQTNLEKPIHEWLRERRLRRGVDLGALAKQTKILRHYFEAIEAGQIHLLPEGIYRRGFLRAYLDGIGVEGTENIESLVSSLTPARPRMQQVEAAGVAGSRSLAGRFRSVRIIAGLLVLFVLAAMAWFHAHTRSSRRILLHEEPAELSKLDESQRPSRPEIGEADDSR